MSVDDDSHIRHRLLIDGDGAGDDRRINMIIKQFNKFAQNNIDESESEMRRSKERLVTLLDSADWVYQKNQLIRAMNQHEQQSYQELYTEIEAGIENTKAEIQKTKEELVQARKSRNNKMEYDALAKAIEKKPSREASGRRIEEVQVDLDDLETTERALEEKLRTRKLQFGLLVHTIQDLMELLSQESQVNGSSVVENAAEDNSLSTSNATEEAQAMDTA